MWFLHLHDVLLHFSHMSSYWGEGIITCGAALLVGCAASCASSPGSEHDDIFHKHIS